MPKNGVFVIRARKKSGVVFSEVPGNRAYVHHVDFAVAIDVYDHIPRGL